jgi:hypothetical protein
MKRSGNTNFLGLTLSGINYRDKDSVLGQVAAEQWAISKFGQQ